MPAIKRAKGDKKMSINEKGNLIAAIIQTLRMAAEVQQKPFDGGDMFFALAFKSDAELKRIAKAARI